MQTLRARLLCHRRLPSTPLQPHVGTFLIFRLCFRAYYLETTEHTFRFSNSLELPQKRYREGNRNRTVFTFVLNTRNPALSPFPPFAQQGEGKEGYLQTRARRLPASEEKLLVKQKEEKWRVKQNGSQTTNAHSAKSARRYLLCSADAIIADCAVLCSVTLVVSTRLW